MKRLGQNGPCLHALLLRNETMARTGFSLIEMLVVIGVISLLAALLLPGLFKVKQKSQSANCLNNLKQLQLAWLSYTFDNDDRMVPNKSRQVGPIQQNVPASWVLGNARHDPSPTNLQNGLLFDYVSVPKIYHCPADRSLVSGQPPHPHRTRSYSLSGPLASDMVGKGWRWEPGRGGPHWKLSSIPAPTPNFFVFIDEHQDGIDDGIFASVFQDEWMELPADRHNGGCNLSFADGHVEHWKWKAAKIFRDYDQPTASALDTQDLRRLQAHRSPEIE